MIFPSRVLCRQLFYCKANQLSGEYISGRSCVVLRAGFPELLHMERSPVIISVWNSDECFPLEQPLCPGPQVFSFYFQTSKVCFEIKGLFQPHKPTVFPRWKKFRSNQLFFFFLEFYCCQFTLFSENTSELQQLNIGFIFIFEGVQQLCCTGPAINNWSRDVTILRLPLSLSFFPNQIQLFDPIIKQLYKP